MRRSRFDIRYLVHCKHKIDVFYFSSLAEGVTFFAFPKIVTKKKIRLVIEKIEVVNKAKIVKNSGVFIIIIKKSSKKEPADNLENFKGIDRIPRPRSLRYQW